MKSFEYFAPKTVQEAVAILSDYRGKARVFAGGTDLIVKMQGRLLTPDVLVDIKRILELQSLSVDGGGGVKIGAAATMRAVERFPLLRESFPAIAQGAGIIGSIQIRNRATVGGNLCNAAPSADIAPSLIALGSRVVIAGPGGERDLPLEDFFLGPGKTVMTDGEVMTHILVPPQPPRTGSAYKRHTTRQAMDIAVACVGVVLSLEAHDSVCKDVKIAMGAVAPTPIRARRAEDLLRGKSLTEDLLREAGEIAAQEARPITDVRGTAEFRRDLIRVLTYRMAQAAMNVAI